MEDIKGVIEKNIENANNNILQREIEILMIEDNLGDVRLIEEMLNIKIQKQFRITNSFSLNEGITLLNKGGFDILFLDLSLPDSQGLESLKLIYNNNIDLPIIILTGIDDEVTAIKAVQMGAQDYIVKGSVNSKLLERFIFHSIERFQIERKLKESKEELQNAFKKTEFLKDILSHDINNIFQNILCATEIIKKILTKANNELDISDFLHHIEEVIDKGAKLISNTKLISQIKNESLESNQINILETLEKVIQELKYEFPEKRIEVKFSLKIITSFLNRDTFFDEIFYNVLKNAIIHNNNTNVEIEINTFEIKIDNLPYIRLEFIDNGIGIVDYRKERIFLRGLDEDESIYGTGLGLSVVKRILDKYQGQIWVEDKVSGDYSKGSKFVIVFPEVKQDR